MAERTVRDLLSLRWPLVPDDVSRRDVWREAWDELHQSGILDALIGAQGRVVYTAEDVAAGAKAVLALHPPEGGWDGLSNEHKQEMLAIAPFARRIGLDIISLGRLRYEEHSGLGELVDHVKRYVNRFPAGQSNYHVFLYVQLRNIIYTGSDPGLNLLLCQG